MELVLPMYNVHPYFSLNNLGKKCALHMGKYGICGIIHDLETHTLCLGDHRLPLGNGTKELGD